MLFPEDIWLLIFYYLDFKDILVNLSLVSKYFKVLISRTTLSKLNFCLENKKINLENTQKILNRCNGFQILSFCRLDDCSAFLDIIDKRKLSRVEFTLSNYSNIQSFNFLLDMEAINVKNVNEEILHLISQNKNLKSLTIQNFDLEVENLEFILELKLIQFGLYSPNLTTLQLFYIIFNLIRNVEYLTFYDCDIDWVCLRKIISNNSKLKALDLRKSTGIKTECVLYLIQRCKTLETLYLEDLLLDSRLGFYMKKYNEKLFNNMYNVYFSLI